MVGAIVRSAMKMTSLIVLCFLAGCATKSSLEQLEDEAMVSGDWLAVEKREQSSNRLGPINGRSCPNGRALICVKNGLREECECVDSRTIP
jgi:hypothetical protein